MNLNKIKDVSAEQQTEAFKMEIFEDIRLFVLKYQRRYYPAYKGELDDLIVDYYTEFTRPKKHRNGEVFSEMDRFQYEKLGGENWTADNSKKLAAYIQRFVMGRLIDSARKDKGEKNYSERYNEETGELSVDFLAKLAAERDPQLEDIEITPELILIARDAYDEMPADKKREFLEIYEDENTDIPENLKKFFKDIVGSDTLESFMNNSSTGPMADKIQEVLGVPVHTERIRIQKVWGLKISFNSVEEARENYDRRDEVVAVLDGKYNNFYTMRGNAWYIKEE